MIARERRASVDAEMKAIPRIAGALAAVCMAGMVLLLLAELALRPFGVLVPSADDFTTFLMVAAAFLGFVHAYAHGQHVRVDLLLKHLPDRLRRPVEIASLLAATALLVWLTVTSAQLATSAYRYHDMSDTVVPVPLWIPMGIVPIGLALFAIATVSDALNAFRGGALRHSESEQEEALELASGTSAGEGMP